MTKAEIEVALLTAFRRCEMAGHQLDEPQKQILLQIVEELAAQPSLPSASQLDEVQSNPLDELTAEQRQALLRFVRDQDESNRSWKAKLLNDWLLGTNSGTVQFIREFYGPQWLDCVDSVHLAQYAELEDEALQVKVGDRIEISNGLWEWVQQSGPCAREWIRCIVVGVLPISTDNPLHVNCIIRFENGTEYEIQGMYEWNRYNWRWPPR